MPFEQTNANATANFGTYNDVQGDQHLNVSEVSDSFNTIIHGVAGRAAVAFGGAFYAYIHDVNYNSVYNRFIIIFATREIADEWWREVSTSKVKVLENNITRVTPQFYTFDTRKWNIYYFFTDAQISSIADKFRGKMFFVQDNNLPGIGITIVPTQSIVDRASGDWFSIRSKVNADDHWYYDVALKIITVSKTQRSAFKVSAPNMHDGAIMIGIDDMTLTVQHHGFVSPKVVQGSVSRRQGVLSFFLPRTHDDLVLQVTTAQPEAFKFKFSDLDKGKFFPRQVILRPGGTPQQCICYEPEGSGNPGWELVL